MTESESAPGQRAIETQIEIGAPVEVVWRALTDADALVRWFPLEARVKPGAGGCVWLSWGPPYEGEAVIEIWEPNRRLRVGSTEYISESRGNKTLSRLAHSGFGTGPGWDEEYEATERGWQFELRGLRHDLERHRGARRLVAWARIPRPVPGAEAWERVMGPQGIFAMGSLASPQPGDRYSIPSADGDMFEGIVQIILPPRDFGATVENWNGAFWRVMLENLPLRGVNDVKIWLSTHSVPRAQVEALRDHWMKMLQKLFPTAS